MNNDKKTGGSRLQFATRMGVIAATVGSSVGLGNIWRFPAEAGSNGGGAFMLCYIIFILLLGIPVICAEFILGRASRSDFFSCFTRLGAPRGWKYIGLIGICASLMILSFYSVVAGWTMEYTYQAVAGGLNDISVSEGGFSQYFTDFSSGTLRPLWWTIGFLAINHLIVSGGVQKGIERMSNIMMPMLFIILIALCINSLLMPGAAKGMYFLFHPDFSKLTPEVILSAMGQAFFSLSLGLGCMLTYASYFSDRTPLVRNAGITAGLDTFVAILAGVMIFPAVFTYGLSPSQGPTLVFEVFPTIFHSMPGGHLWSSLFFFMLFLASLTSTISMSEISIAYLVDKIGMKRRAACRVSTAIALTGGALCALSFNGITNFNIGDYTFDFFNFFNDTSSNVLLPIGGMLISIYAGWVLDRKIFNDQLTNDGQLRGIPVRLIRFLLRYVCPMAIAVIFAASIGLL